MAQQTMTVKIEPSPELEKMIRRVLAANAKPGPTAPRLAPVTKQVPSVVSGVKPDQGGEYVMFLDQCNRVHWIASTHTADREALGWRQVFTLLP